MPRPDGAGANDVRPAAVECKMLSCPDGHRRQAKTLAVLDGVADISCRSAWWVALGRVRPPVGCR